MEAKNPAGTQPPKGDQPADVYALDIEEQDSSETATIMREAVAAVEARSRGDGADPEDAVLDDDSSDDAEPPEAASAEELAAQVAELQERSLRALADYENYRKRVAKEREDVERYAAFEPLKSFLPIIDNMERAVAATGTEEDLRAGVEMILRQMHEVLRRFRVEAVPAEGERFDPTVHQAVASEEADDVDRPTVTEEMQRGFLLHERLLRPAMVRVAVPGADSPEDDDGKDEGSESAEAQDGTEVQEGTEAQEGTA